MVGNLLGIPVINIQNSITVSLANEEWQRWISYLSKEDQEAFDKISAKPIGQLTQKEINWFNQVTLEKRIATNLRARRKLTKAEVAELNNYFENTSLEALIKRKLTKAEYKHGLEVAKEILNNNSEEQLKAWCEEQLDNYKKLSIIDSFIIREVRKREVYKSNKKDAECLEAQLAANAASRNRSENGSSIILK